MSKLFVLLSILHLCLVLRASAGSDDPVTCGSVVKLMNTMSNTNLHSHQIAWGSGSGQQSITASGSNNDQGDLWIIKDATTAKAPCVLATPLSCNSRIRLEHMQTGKLLHSHLFKAPLTGNQEVSGFGEAGNGDTGDNWTVVCDGESEKLWIRGQPIHLQHVDTSKYLYTSEQAKFTTSNCGHGCPIMGQLEVSASQRKDARSKWISTQGVYFPPREGGDSKDEL